jgi:hypothetical protein
MTLHVRVHMASTQSFFWKAYLSIKQPLTAHDPIHPQVLSRYEYSEYPASTLVPRPDYQAQAEMADGVDCRLQWDSTTAVTSSWGAKSDTRRAASSPHHFDHDCHLSGFTIA